MEPVYRAVEVLGHTLFRFQGLRLTMTGTDRVPRSGGAVIAINHTAYVDPLFAGVAVRDSGRWLRFMAKQEVFDHPLSGPIMRGAKQIAVDRTDGSASFAAAVDNLRRGEIVGVYPEATISRSFELKDFKTGAARMALEAQVPIVPVIVWGAQRIWTKGAPRRLGRTKTPIRIAVGEPLPPAGTSDELMALLRERMDALRSQVVDECGPYPRGEHWVPARLGGGAPTRAEADALDARDQAEREARRQARATDH